MDWSWLDAWWVPPVFIGIGSLFWYYIGYNPFAQKEWEQLPTRDEYKALYPECVDGERLRCCHCGADFMLDLGLLQFEDWRRRLLCRKCKHYLWREDG